MRLIPENSPKPIRITALITFMLFMACGIATTLRFIVDFPQKSKASLFGVFLFFVLLAIAAALAVAWAWLLINKAGHKVTLKNADEVFRHTGFSQKLAETFTAAPYPEDDDIVISAYLLTAAECYKEAETALIPIDRTSLSQRTLALLNTTVLRIYYMMGRQEKIKRHIENTRERSETAYEMKPEMLNEYKPYLDDELDFDLLNAVYAAQCGNRDLTDRYMRKLMFRISMRDEADRELYPLIADLSLLYAEGKYPEAHQLEQRLEGEIVNFSVPLSQPHRDELMRRVAQARIFATMYDMKAKAALDHTEPAAPAAEEPFVTARRLPTEAQMQQGIRPEDCGLDLF